MEFPSLSSKIFFGLFLAFFCWKGPGEVKTPILGSKKGWDIFSRWRKKTWTRRSELPLKWKNKNSLVLICRYFIFGWIKKIVCPTCSPLRCCLRCLPTSNPFTNSMLNFCYHRWENSEFHTFESTEQFSSFQFGFFTCKATRFTSRPNSKFLLYFEAFLILFFKLSWKKDVNPFQNA